MKNIKHSSNKITTDLLLFKLVIILVSKKKIQNIYR